PERAQRDVCHRLCCAAGDVWSSDSGSRPRAGLLASDQRPARHLAGPGLEPGLRSRLRPHAVLWVPRVRGPARGKLLVVIGDGSAAELDLAVDGEPDPAPRLADTGFEFQAGEMSSAPRTMGLRPGRSAAGASGGAARHQ